MVNLIQQNIELEGISFEESDLFERKEFWNLLYRLIENSQNESLVISINAPWWEWKSYFLKMWQNDLIQHKKDVIYFNAFKNDYIEDPFVALLWELMNYYKENNSEIKIDWIKVIKWLIPLAGKIWARILLGWAATEIEHAIDDDITNFIWTRLDEYSKKEEDLRVFKETIANIIQKNGSLVFIVDELDRCRPDFALRLLERLKHFFNIKWLYFVLWINKEPLEKHIQKIYGDIDTATYLQKFIDVEALLPKNLQIERHDCKKYVEFLFEEQNNIWDEKIDSEAKGYRKRLLVDFTIMLNLSLREIEKIINYLVLFHKSAPSKHRYMSYFTPMICIIVIIRAKNLSTYKKLKENTLQKKEIIEFLKIEASPSIYKKYILADIDFFFEENLSEELKNRYNRTWYMLDDLSSRQALLKDFLAILDSFNI